MSILFVKDADGNKIPIPSIKGEKGDTPTISIGRVMTLSPGSSATVSANQSDNGVVLNFGIPQGEQGEQGEVGNATNCETTDNKVDVIDPEMPEVNNVYPTAQAVIDYVALVMPTDGDEVAY